jgi:hypothetical protein
MEFVTWALGLTLAVVTIAAAWQKIQILQYREAIEDLSKETDEVCENANRLLLELKAVRERKRELESAIELQKKELDEKDEVILKFWEARLRDSQQSGMMAANNHQNESAAREYSRAMDKATGILTRLATDVLSTIDQVTGLFDTAQEIDPSFEVIDDDRELIHRDHEFEKEIAEKQQHSRMKANMDAMLLEAQGASIGEISQATGFTVDEVLARAKEIFIAAENGELKIDPIDIRAPWCVAIATVGENVI